MDTCKLRRLAAIFAIGLLGACVNSPEPSHKGPTVLSHTGSLARTMRGVTTFSLHPTARIVRPGKGTPTQPLLDHMDSALVSFLSAHGYTHDPTGNGDRMVAFAIGVSAEINDVQLTKVFGISAGLGFGEGNQRGGIVLVVMNPKTGAVTWRSGASGSSYRKAETAEERYEAIDRAIAKMMQTLPMAR